MDENKITISINKKKLKVIALITAAIALVAVFLVILISAFTPEKSAVLTMKSGDIFRIKMVILTDRNAYLKYGKKKYEDFDIAYSDTEEISYVFKKINVTEIESIHYILEKTEDEKIDDDTDNEKTIYDPDIFGTYKIKVSGHDGFLYLRNKDGKIYGGLKFPNWANGVYEPIKRLRIDKNRISFTRSATSLKEIRRLGISTYFTQTFSGSYNSKTREIKGFYVNNNAKKSWNAEKIK